MKKIININLSGRVIPIEDSAYENLQAYIESLRRYFASEEGRDEIINDIESRIAELMNEKIRKGASCITDSDVDEIIASMGRPADFEAEAAEDATTTGQGARHGNYYSEKNRGRLYRDSSDKFIGGVCSGIANYLNTDPAIIRILFAIITFGGFGIGCLLYVILWIMLPVKDLDGYSGKRLYRNPDDKVIGGVAGGLAAYFNVRTSNIRLLFAAPILLSLLISLLNGLSWQHDFDIFPNILFGSLSSTFALTYVVLWIVLPEARSTYEKMEMRGEKVDVNSIRQNVKDGMGNFKEKVKNWGEEVKQSAQNLGDKTKEFANTKGKEFTKEMSETTRRAGRGVAHAIGVLFKAFFLFIAGTIAFALFVTVIALIFGGIAWWPINDFLWTSKWQQAFAWGTLIFFLLVPLVGIIVWIIRRVAGVRSRHSYLGWTFSFLWAIGWVSVVMLAVSIGRDFREYENVATTIPVAQPMNGKMIVVVSQPKLEYTGRFSWIDDDAEGWDLAGDTARLSTVRFHFIKSSDSAYHVIMRKYSFGKTEEEAKQRAEKIQYDVYSRDSVLDLGNGYTIDRESRFRGQQVEIEIRIPAGKKIMFDETVNHKLNPVNFKVRGRNIRIRRRGSDSWREDSYYYRTLRSNVDYTMGIDGYLQDSYGNAVKQDDYRWEDGSAPGDQQSLEERERLWKEEGQKIKEEKEKQKQQKPSTRINNTHISKNDAIANVAIPVLSLSQSFFK